MFKRIQYNVILMDIQMPVIDGYEATGKIRKLEEKYFVSSKSLRVPIIAMTAHAMEGYRERCLKAGMDDYISKPLDRKLLIKTVGKWQHTANQVIDKSPVIPPQPKYRNNDFEIDSNNAPIDFKKALLEFEGDREFLLEVIVGFIENVKRQLVTIQKALDNGDAEVIRQEAHSIKGGAANLTAENLAKWAYDLELLGNSGNLSEAEAIFVNLEKEFTVLDVYIQEINKNN